MVSIVLPVYNEQTAIQETMHKVTEILEGQDDDFEIIVVDDGSTDGSGRLIAEIAKEEPKVKVEIFSKNQGYGKALRAGFQRAAGNKIIYLDSDGQYASKNIIDFIDQLDQYDLVVGKRTTRVEGFGRWIMSWLWTNITGTLFNLHVTDVNCGIKGFKKTLYEQVSLKSNGAMISAELLLKSNRKGFSIKEIPVVHLPRKGGSPTGLKLKVVYRSIIEIFKMYFDSRKM